MKNYKWLYSYETYGFDTIDGNLHHGEYALPNDDLGGFLIFDPKNSSNFFRVQELDITRMTQVNRVTNRAFDIFEDPDTKTKERYSCNLQVYKDLALRGAGPRIKLKE